MKKNIFILLALLGMAKLATAQSFIGSLFTQKKQQTKLLLQQIAALEVYKGYLEKGYNIAKFGLNTIGDIKNGEFKLHKTFFGSLKAVNPKVKQYSRVADIIQLQLQSIAAYHKTMQRVLATGMYSEEELAYLKKVFERLMEACGQTLDELITLVTDGELEMKDDERIARIDLLHEQMLEHYTFTSSFSQTALQMALYRKHEGGETKYLKDLNGIESLNP